MLQQFDDENIQAIIDKKAPAGIKIGQKGNVKLDISYEKHVSHRHGLSSGLKELKDTSPDSKTKKLEFRHVDSKNIAHNLYVNVGVGIDKKVEKEFKKLCEEHSELFFTEDDFFPYLLDKEGKPYVHRLNLREDAVIRSNPVALKLPPDHQEALSKAIKMKLRNNTFVRIPRNSQSYCNPVSVVPKSTFDEHGNKKWRLIQSMVNISEHSLFINFKLESPRELIEKVPTDARFYNFFDSVSSFDSLKLHDDDIKYTGFLAPDPDMNGKTFEIFGCSRVPQGHLNGSPNLVKTYNDIYKDCILDCGLAIYCDDFLLGQRTQWALLQATRQVLSVSAQARVRFSPLKSFWFVSSGIFCGLQLRKGALTVPAKYAEKVQDCQTPTNKSQLQRFLGLVNYTRSFIPDYSKYAAELIAVMNKMDEKGRIPWDESQKTAFAKLKENILSPLSLFSVDYHAKDSSLHLYFDSSKNSRAACLFQKLKNTETDKEEFKLIDYFSQTIPESQRWSGILRNEWMALISSSEIWHRYLLIPSMDKFIYTDSKALWLMTKHRCRNPRIFEFINSLKSIYSPVTFLWKKSEENFADIFTRPEDFMLSGEQSPEKVLEIFTISNEINHIKRAIADDPEKIRSFEQVKSITHGKFLNDQQRKPVLALLRSGRMTTNDLKVLEQIADGESTDSSDSFLDEEPGRLDNLREIQRPRRQLLDLSRNRMFKEIGDNMRQTLTDPVEKAERAHALMHIQRTSLIELFKITKRQAEDILRNCERCQKHQSRNKHVQIKQRPYTKPLGPMVEGSMDVLHIGRNKYYLGVRDSFSSFLSVQPITNLREETIYTALMKIHMRCGLPVTLKVDGASYFVGKHFKSRMADRSVFLKTIAVANSNGNNIERLWRLVRDFLRRTGTSWDSVDTLADMHSFINKIAQKVWHGEKHYSPFELHFGIKPYLSHVLQLEIPDKNYQPIQTPANYKEIALAHNGKILPVKPLRGLKIGTTVKYKKYGSKNSELLSGVIEDLDEETVTLRNEKGNFITRHLKDVIA